MYDIEKLVSIVCELLEAQEDDKKFNLEVRKRKGYMPDTDLWIPSLGGSEAFRMGELYERCNHGWRILADVCDMLDIDQNLLIAAVKSMQRKERHNGHWDNPNYTSCIEHKDKERLVRFLTRDKGEHGYHPWYASTGRTKAWCK